MDIDWIPAPVASLVVGIAPDGGLLIHASLHPLGSALAVGCAKHAGVDGCQHGGETYFPMPWIRSELSAVLKREPTHTAASLLARIYSVLYVTLPTLQKRADTVRFAARGQNPLVKTRCKDESRQILKHPSAMAWMPPAEKQ
jgi:hypothetical protein